MEISTRQRIAGRATNGADLRAPVLNEHEVRAAAGLTMVIGAVAFSYAYFHRSFIPMRIVTALLSAEFLARLTLGLRCSPIGAVARALTLAQPPEWVSAKPKRFAWTLGLAMSSSMVVLTNVGVRGMVPRTICLTCLSLMWMESVLGLCLGCRIYALLVRRGLTAEDAAVEVCAQGECERAIGPIEA